jgi:voltage-gated potassium channel Kch
MRTFSLAERIRYAFDNYMARGAGALVVGLAVLTLALILAAGAILALSGIGPEGGEGLSLPEAVWTGFMHTLDSGAVGADSGWAFRFVMLAVTIGGILILSTLIGVLSSGLEGRLEALRRGRSVLVESGHTVILGYSGQIFPIIEQLIFANQSQRRACIAILSERDKTEVEEELRERIGRTGRTRIIVRSGSPTSADDLSIVNLGDARSVIVLADGREEPDASTIKTLLAILKEEGRSGGTAPIVAQIEDAANLQPAAIASQGRAVIIKTGQLVSRIIAQCCRQSGLSQAYLELLDFKGNEMYFRENPRLESMCFRDALFLYPDEAAMGVVGADGKAVLNPPMDRRFARGEILIVLAQDDVSSQAPAAQARINELLLSPAPREKTAPDPERTLILGWNWKVPLIIRELEGYAAAGSAVTVAASDSRAREGLAGLDLAKQVLELCVGDTCSRAFLESLDPCGYDRVVVMSPQDQPDVERADARSLVTLLHLRDIARKSGRDPVIVSEILDIRNRDLADAAEADDFIVSDRILSLMMAMLAENPGLESVFEDLLDAGGSEIYLKAVEGYLKPGAEMNFATVLEAAARRGETAIGYCVAAEARDPSKSFGVHLNPHKDERRAFRAGDRLIVLAVD